MTDYGLPNKINTIESLSRKHKDRYQRVGLKVFVRIARKWRLNDADKCRLLQISEIQLELLLSDLGARLLDEDVQVNLILRLSFILGVFRAVAEQLPKKRWYAFLHVPNAHFQNESLMTVMLEN